MFNRGGFPGQRPMGHGLMNQPGMNQPGMNQPSMNQSGINQPGMNQSGINQPSISHPGMNMSGMNMPGMGMAPMNQSNMNLSGMNHPGMNHQHMGHPGMNHPNMGLSGMNQPNMNMNRMNPPGMNQGGAMGFGMRPMGNTGSFGGNADPMGMKGMPMRPPMHTPPDRHMGPQGLPQRFPSLNVPVHQGQPRMPSQNQEIASIVNRVLTHSSDRIMAKPKAPLQEPAHLLKEKQWDNLNVFGNVSQDMGMKSTQSGPSHDQVSNAQNRYNNESASSILESFGLSNEDLEELSRYPDDQLTPSNMPGILRDIRLRKMNRSAPVTDPAAGRRPGSEAVPSKVIDYGHSSKYQFTDTTTPARSYEPPRTEQKPSPVVAKEPAAPSNAKPKITPEKGMDNKIPTISGSRKPTWQTPKIHRSNNKTLVGDETASPVDASVTVSTVSNIEKPVISVQAEATTAVTTTPDVVAPVQTESPAAQAVTGASQTAFEKPAQAPAVSKGSWVPVPPVSQEETQKMKKLPTPSMMNDYYAASPRIFPHICSLCNVECRHLKDWIKHQNNSSHIESCRNLRQQYPDWNPQVLSSVRSDAKNDDTASKTSKSKSASPRRSRRSGSLHKSRKSRSRSPRSSGRRSRSRSPHRPRHSPRRSRSPRRGARSPCRSRSPRRFKRSSRSNSPDKRAVDAAVQNFIESTKKLKTAKPSGNGKKAPPKPTNSNFKSKKPASSAPPPRKPGSAAPKPVSTSTSSSSTRKPSSSADKPSSNNAPPKPTATSSAPKKPNSTGSSYKKPVVSTGVKKTTPSSSSGKKPQASKQPASSQKIPESPSSQETFNPLNKFTSKISFGKIVHVTNLPDSGYTDQDLLKIVQPFGKVCDILIVRSKNEAFMETHFREAATAAVKFSESTPIMINNQRVTLSMAGQSKKPMKMADKGGKLKEEPAKAAALAAAPKKDDKSLQEKTKDELEVPPGFIRCYMLDNPPLKQSEQCVLLISNLPPAQYTVDEITNLAKPFGGVNDVVIIANHRKAYLELTSRNSLDSMIKFYSVFPTYLSGNLLSICIATRYKDLKDEDLLFADLIEQASYKITPTIYEKFVYLTNLPDKDVEDFEIIRVGLRFGKVQHHVYLSNKKKAILHLHSPSAAKAMCSFLTQYPCSIKDTVVACSLPSKTKLAENEYLSYIEEDKPSPEISAEKTASAGPKAEEPEEGAAAPAAPASQKEMGGDPAESKGASAPPPAKDFAGADATSAPVPAKPPSLTPSASCYMVLATEDDGDDDEEEAAEAPEAPDTTPLYVPAVPEIQRQDSHPVPQPLVSEELEVLVSVESDEEEPEEQHPFIFSPRRALPPLPVPERDNRKTSDERKVAAGDTRNTISQPGGIGNKRAEGPSTARDPSAGSSSVEEGKEPSLISAGKAKTISASEEGATEDTEKSGQATSEKGRDGSEASETGQAAAASSSSMIRTTKYNAQKGEISVTVTLESQKSTAKSTDPRKRTSRERGTSAHESSTPRSNSNRSSPANGASGHTKFTSKYGKYVSSQLERDPKEMARQRERDARSSSRKDDRTRGNSSSRYTRTSKSNNRSPRSKEEEETFPFNLDEFVTVDEIVEEQLGSKKEPEEKSDAARKGKRKETDPLLPDSKKSRVTGAAPHDPSFVTLDEIGDEEEGAGAQDNLGDQADQSLVTLDEVHAEDGPPASAKQEQMLMTLDEISDDDDAQDSSAGRRSSARPDILAKDQLVTLDEVNDEDEEHAVPAKPSKVAETKLQGDAKDTKVKGGEDSKELEAKPDAQRDALASGGRSEQPLLTLDEVKADEEEMSFADIEHQFLTVDEIGEEEEESEMTAEKSKPEAKDSGKPQLAPAAKRGRPRKRPLPQSAEDTASSTQPGAPDTSTPKKTPAAKAKLSDKCQGAAEVATSATPEKAEAGDKTATETAAKKMKLESPAAVKQKLAPFNSSPVGLEFLVPKTGYFCELCSLFYMDDSSKLKHCRSLRHYQAVEKHLAKPEAPEGRSAST